MKMQEMIYGGDGTSKLLYTEGDEDGYNLAVINCRGSHPCAYVQFPGVEKIESYDDIFMNGEYPHGGFTYLGDLEDFDLTGTWIGWDYAHWDDYTWCCYAKLDFGKKWTTEEVVEEARKILNQIEEGEMAIIS